MPTFQRTETVDARQFTGGCQQGTDLAFWVNSNGGRAFWKDAQKIGDKHLSERISLEVKNGCGLTFDEFTIVWINDWVIHHQDGSWSAIRPEDLKEQYEEV
ncbi:hypothetical protein SEA_MEDIUMFRY_66 [Arthrobacter phage MediumFry]|nr:hypothetical protein SEA_MEDIUMFRY_66 [Arthrobacter phage MediumFry]